MSLGFFILFAAHLIWAAQPSLASSGGSSRLWQKPTGHVAASWYAAWHVDDIPLASVNWTKYDMVFYAFGLTTPDASEIGLQDSDKQLIPQFVQTAHSHNVAALLSIGGWTGSRFFSSAVGTDANRTAFAKAIVDVVSQYQLDGIELDWEYPTASGIGCNVKSADDSANFLSFLQTLRSMAPNLILSAAVQLSPFQGANGQPMSDVSEFAKVLDYIEIMNYDVWGSFSPTVGPNAPLNDSCAPPADQQGSATSAVQAWSKAGFPTSQIILGVPSYGHSFRVDRCEAFDASGKLKLYPTFNKNDQPAGDKWDGTAGGVDICGNPNVVGGIFDFWGLIDAGFLRSNGTTAHGIHHAWDKCSKTPFVYNSTSEVMISYDDAKSFYVKGHFIHEMGLAGFSMWETGGDYNNILVDSIRLAMHMTP